MSKILNNFIVIEGLDGAGTTTQLKKLSQKLIQLNQDVYITNEPTSRPIGALVRKVLAGEFKTTALTLAKLYATDREDHIYNKEDGIIHQLDANKIVISDRYFYSSLAYQGITCNFETVKNLNSEYPHPQILFYIETPVEECIKRIDNRGEKKDIFEKQDFLEKVNNNYNKILKNIPNTVNLVKIDGTLSIDEITEIMFNSVKNILSL